MRLAEYLFFYFFLFLTLFNSVQSRVLFPVCPSFIDSIKRSKESVTAMISSVIDIASVFYGLFLPDL